MANSVTFFPSYYEAIRPLPDEERLTLYDAILDYGMTGAEPENLPPLLVGYYVLLRSRIDEDREECHV